MDVSELINPNQDKLVAIAAAHGMGWTAGPALGDAIMVHSSATTRDGSVTPDTITVDNAAELYAWLGY